MSRTTDGAQTTKVAVGEDSQETGTFGLNPGNPAADVLVPVHGNLPVTRRCLESVLASRTASLGDVVVIDDASPDEETGRYLDSLRDRGTITLLRHPVNQGFVGAIATGLTATRRDVVLLNSDTDVHGDWLERLVRCLAGAADIATVTPLTNHGTICSYPFPPWRRRLPAGLSLATMDGLFARVNQGMSIDVPTGVGFCLLIRRACLDEIGGLDRETFGRGYGEETDFCQRARLAGWRHRVCADTFVFHALGASFGAERRRRAVAAERTLRHRYPDYARLVLDFIERDPLRDCRRRVDAARIALSPGQAAGVALERALEYAARPSISVWRRASVRSR